MILSNNLHRLLLVILLIIAGFMSAIISNVKIPTLIILSLLFVYMYHYKLNSKYYITIFLLLSISVAIAMFNSLATVFYAAYLIMFSLMFYVGVNAFNLERVLKDNCFLFIVNFFTISLFVIVFVAFALGLDTNSLLPTGSRNSLGALILSMGALSYLLSKRYRYTFLFVSIFLLLSLGGRTNQFVAILIAMYICVIKIDSKIFNMSILVLAGATLFIIESTLGLDNFLNLVFVNDAGTSIGLRSLRSIVWAEWAENITLLKFLTGFSLSELPFVSGRLNGNPHNSFILIHSYTGILSVLFLCWLIYKCLTVKWRVSFFVGLLLFKGFFDTILTPSSLDVFILVFLFIGHYGKVRNI